MMGIFRSARRDADRQHANGFVLIEQAMVGGAAARLSIFGSQPRGSVPSMLIDVAGFVIAFLLFQLPLAGTEALHINKL
jgi:hypothetical protein